ncbi:MULTISPECIES: NB-ARC domain-containing protein [unclassified Streptomyces]|uniref:NB-ARC domain-containing protein n=1 Tax=unclassified Streptomyces TaxID=2593676 RepID=UPI00093A10CF|nr:NB-ARC domain-containing protein [Streptomyces sp. TSRI0107]
MTASAEASGDRSIAAGGSIRQAISGDGSVGMYAETALTLPAEAFAMPEAAPDGLVNLPERAGLFVGRERELALLDEAFQATGGVVVQAVHGLGGIGKSTLAARWAAERTDVFNPVWWINAETTAELDAGLADLAIALQPALRDVLSREALRERAVRWLAAHEGWLLVLDNVSSPTDVKALLARATGGRFLITTRRATGWHGIAEPLSLDVLELAEATELFARVQGGAAADAEGLCRELGCLPLAVEQAAAYCAEAGITADEYAELLARYPERMFASAAEGGSSERTVARVWRVTLDRLADTPLAGVVLRTVAWWAPDGIPRAYLEPLGSPPEVTDAIRRLAAHSMISLHDDGTISVHRLVQAVARSEGEVYADRAARLLAGAGLHLGDAADEERWLTHLEALASCTRPENDAEGAAMLFWPGGIRYAHRDAVHAIRLSERALAAAERACGSRHALTVAVRAGLAQACRAAGDGERAIELLERNVTEHVRAFGRRDPRTFEARNEVIEQLVRSGRARSALAPAARNARKAERVLGRDAQQAILARAAWASALGELAKTDPARFAKPACDAMEGLLRRAVAATGRDSGVCGSIRIMLVWARRSAGDIAGAAALYEEFVESEIRRRGPADRIVLESRTLLVRFLWNMAADPARAREIAVPLLADWERLLGDTPYVRGLRQEFAPLLAA